ncbi:hypothetical protein F5Y12DRAFT_774440 [Xylaria sp. FL1777]|nr:hypothetical protein F5Y12DRAFT_774440 [Xylaria sp. FL1777]
MPKQSINTSANKADRWRSLLLGNTQKLTTEQREKGTHHNTCSPQSTLFSSSDCPTVLDHLPHLSTIASSTTSKDKDHMCAGYHIDHPDPHRVATYLPGAVTHSTLPLLPASRLSDAPVISSTSRNQGDHSGCDRGPSHHHHKHCRHHHHHHHHIHKQCESHSSNRTKSEKEDKKHQKSKERGQENKKDQPEQEHRPNESILRHYTESRSLPLPHQQRGHRKDREGSPASAPDRSSIPISGISTSTSCLPLTLPSSSALDSVEQQIKATTVPKPLSSSPSPTSSGTKMEEALQKMRYHSEMVAHYGMLRREQGVMGDRNKDDERKAKDESQEAQGGNSTEYDRMENWHMESLVWWAQERVTLLVQKVENYEI